MTPLVVRARVDRSLVAPWHPIGLDALLMASVALRDNLPPLGFGERADIEIPVAKSPCGRVYLASEAQYAVEEHEQRWLNKRFPIAEAQALASPKVKRILTSGGLSKGFRLPMDTLHLVRDTVTWYAVGDEDGVRDLVHIVSHLGKRRGVGYGRVASWDVAPCESWDGFPVLRGGVPLRPLPRDYPGLGSHRVERRVLSPPYWERWREEEAAVPA